MIWCDLDHWLNAPAAASATPGGLLVRTRPRTDFWQRTHYGFRRDDGHLLWRAVAGDFRAEVGLRLMPNAKYDQAGLMVRRSEADWLKTSLEFEPGGPSHLGVVATQGGYSDWSMGPVPFSAGVPLGFRVERRSADYTFHAKVGAKPWVRIRLLHLQADDGAPLMVGPYACSPDGEGCQVLFHTWRVEQLS